MAPRNTPNEAEPEGEPTPSKTPVLDPSLAPPSSSLPPDAMGNPAAPFDSDAFKAELKRRNVVTIWKSMTEKEASARQLPTGGTMEVTIPGEDGKPVPAVMKPADPVAAAAEVGAEASRLRQVATTLLDVHGVSELDLLQERIAELTRRLDNHQRELAAHQALRDSPDEFGYVMLDGTTPIDHEAEVMTCQRMEATHADMKAELAYYASQRKDG